ncbi:MAG: D-alanine--D-alanine ligase [Planctomycetaceae bacterium]|nr:D-alanine--D-alanine ligase [Planctomycetaceae bacterium]
MDALDITVLLGGPSPEREVSLLSGAAVADALDRLGHRVTRADIGPRDTSALDRKGIDLVFIVLHGEFGEDGQVQTLCEQRGLRYTFSGPHASLLAMDKAASKQAFLRAGLVTPAWMVIEEFHDAAKVLKWLTELPPPVVVKPVGGGSSVDVVIARTPAQRDEAMAALLDKNGRVMLERYVAGREFTVGVLGEQALPVLEIVPDGEFYDYRAKYSDEATTQYLFDSDIPPATAEKMQQWALAAHAALGCRDLSRVDFMLGTDGVPQVMEVNTIPGFTSHSLVPMAARRIGISFDQLVERIVALAMQR